MTVTSPTAQHLYPQVAGLRVWVGKIDASQMVNFCQQQHIIAIVDASHPYAKEVSQNAITVAAICNLPYLRYERPVVEACASSANVIELASLDELLAGDYLEARRVLLTLGYQALPRFQSWQERSILFARILPRIKSLEVALASGFSANRIIALRPPITAQLERALWQQWKISVVVTKASGSAGGEDTKRMVAQELGITLIVIARPSITYPQKTSNLAEILAFCRQYIF